jgi:hypothetical protein
MTDEMDIEGALKVLEYRLQTAEARLDEHQRSISILASRDDKIVHWQETHDWHHTVVPAPSARHHDIPVLPSLENMQARLQTMEQALRESIPAFVARVNARAEAEMMRTGTLEGAHHRAIEAELTANQEGGE